MSCVCLNVDLREAARPVAEEDSSCCCCRLLLLVEIVDICVGSTVYIRCSQMFILMCGKDIVGKKDEKAREKCV